MIDKNVLKKYADSPGLCSLSETKNVEEFIKEYMQYRDLYRSAFGIDPTMLTLESNLDTVEWYKKFHEERQGE